MPLSERNKVIASSLNEYALGPQEEHLSLSIQRSETASVVGEIGSSSLLSYNNNECAKLLWSPRMRLTPFEVAKALVLLTLHQINQPHN
ncbi:hypothetical protein KY285_016388 [Solanum tuberosum]|nr:hypothetical protein KY284_016383 [Solanum tuberosum]KAH0702110.1 hypothetical protein KY285_016388 [Solanum tuberosum]